MYPLKDYFNLERTYTYGVPTFYNDFHIGVDIIVPVGTPIYAPTKGQVKSSFGTQGGNTLYFTDSKDVLWRFLHCLRINATGIYQEGDIIGWTGNTGLSTKPHTHLDIWKEGKVDLANAKTKTVDPDKYVAELTESELNVPQWVLDNGTLEYGQETGIMTDFTDIDQPLPAYRVLEMLRKQEEYLKDKYDL